MQLTEGEKSLSTFFVIILENRLTEKGFEEGKGKERTEKRIKEGAKGKGWKEKERGREEREGEVEGERDREGNQVDTVIEY